jgi:hypothetical protein
MIFAPLAGFALVMTIATGPVDNADPTSLQMSTREKSAAIQPLVQRATDCIASRVAADPHSARDIANGKLGDLIVDSVPPCIEAVRAMIDAHDRYFGDGTGEVFFMGPYLDVLPTAVTRQVKAPGPHSEVTHAGEANGVR